MMNDIQGVHPPTGPEALQPANKINSTARPAEAAELIDVVEISTAAQLAAKVHELPEVRTELVERVKSQIAAGTYETPQHVDVAVERLMEELFGNL